MVKTYTAMADCCLHERSNVQFWKGKLTCPLRRTSVHRNYCKPPVGTEETKGLSIWNWKERLQKPLQHAYIIVIRGWSNVLRTIQMHSNRQPEHPGGSNAKVTLVCEGPLQVVHIRSRDSSLWVTGSSRTLPVRTWRKKYARLKAKWLMTSGFFFFLRPLLYTRYFDTSTLEHLHTMRKLNWCFARGF